MTDKAPNPLQAAGVVIIDRSGAVLLLQRPSGEWGIPGGKLEAGETPAFAAIREIEEETGITLSPGQLVALACVNNPDGYDFTAFAARVDRCEVTMRDGEHTAWVWATPDALPAPLFMQSEALVALALQAPATGQDAALADMNGWKEFSDNPISRVGVFPYSGQQIVVNGMELEANKIYNVLRPEDELSNPETIDSFKLVPWIAGHTMLGDNYTPAEKKGIGGVVGERVYYKDGVLYGNLKMFSSGHASLIDQGLKDLSLGYRCTYEYAPGVFDGQQYDFVQRNIRGNHVATVPEGRMGPTVAVRDSFTFDAKETAIMADEKDTGENQVQKLDLKAMTLPELLSLMEQLGPIIKEMQDAAAAAGGTPAEPAAVDTTSTTDKDEEADAEAERLGEEARIAQEKKDREDERKGELAAVAEDAAVLTMRKLGERDALARKIAPLVGVFDHSAMTAGEVAKYGCSKLGIAVAKGQDAATLLAGYMAAANRRAAPAAAAMDAAPTATISALSALTSED